MGETKRAIAILLITAMAALLCSPVFAEGLIRINPALPVMLSSPATFTVDVQSDGPASAPHILLVMDEDCYDGLTGPVLVTWSGGSASIPKAAFTEETDNSVNVPPGTTPGASYTVASLKSHLSTEGPIYWAFVPFLAGPITTTPQEFTVTLPSTEPKMLVYALGKSPTTTEGLYDMFVPPTIPGFVVPELATILLVAASMSAFAVYGIKRRKM